VDKKNLLHTYSEVPLAALLTREFRAVQ